MMTYSIEIACDHEEGARYKNWLISQGHDARIGNSTGTYINGSRTSLDEDALDISNELWSKYCNS
jgi:hypothetical protein